MPDPITFTIPHDIAGAIAVGNNLGAIATASGWARAYLVYAFVRVANHGGDRSKVRPDLAGGKMTPQQFAALGIHGLKGANTVREYWYDVDNAITDGVAEPVAPGSNVVLPEAPFDDYHRSLIVRTEPEPEVKDLDSDDDDEPDSITEPDWARLLFNKLLGIQRSLGNAVVYAEKATATMGCAERGRIHDLIVDTIVRLDDIDCIITGRSPRGALVHLISEWPKPPATELS